MVRSLSGWSATTHPSDLENHPCAAVEYPDTLRQNTNIFFNICCHVPYCTSDGYSLGLFLDSCILPQTQNLNLCLSVAALQKCLRSKCIGVKQAASPKKCLHVVLYNLSYLENCHLPETVRFTSGLINLVHNHCLEWT